MSLNDSFDNVVFKYSDMVTRICVIHTGNPEYAKDCFQNTFIKLFKKYPKFNDTTHLKAWIIRVAINECATLTRSSWFKKTVGLEEVTAVWNDVSENGILAKVLQLDDIYRDAIYLHYYEGYSINEISNVLKTNSNTIKTRLSRARESLRSSIGGEFDDYRF